MVPKYHVIFSLSVFANGKQDHLKYEVLISNEGRILSPVWVWFTRDNNVMVIKFWITCHQRAYKLCDKWDIIRQYFKTWPLNYHASEMSFVSTRLHNRNTFLLSITKPNKFIKLSHFGPKFSKLFRRNVRWRFFSTQKYFSLNAK